MASVRTVTTGYISNHGVAGQKWVPLAEHQEALREIEVEKQMMFSARDVQRIVDERIEAEQWNHLYESVLRQIFAAAGRTFRSRETLAYYENIAVSIEQKLNRGEK